MIIVETERFDGLVKTLGQSQGRREALRLLGGTVLSAALGVAGRTRSAAAAATCKGPGKRCANGGDCCSGRCKNDRCRCSRFERRCRSNSDCCQGGVTAYCDLRCVDPACSTCAPTDQPTGYCKDDSYCGGVRP